MKSISILCHIATGLMIWLSLPIVLDAQEAAGASPEAIEPEGTEPEPEAAEVEPEATDAEPGAGEMEDGIETATVADEPETADMPAEYEVRETRLEGDVEYQTVVIEEEVEVDDPEVAALAAAEEEVGRLIQAGRHGEALSQIRTLTAKYPTDVFLLRIEGYCLFMLDRHAEAVAVYRRCIALAPNDPASHYYLAQALAYSGAIQEAIVATESVARLAPETEYAEMAVQQQEEHLEPVAHLTDPVQRQRGWNLNVGTTAKYDTNVPARSNDSDAPGSQESWVFSFAGEGDYTIWDQTFDGKPFTLGVRGGAYQSLHEAKDLSGFDLLALDLGMFATRHAEWFSMPVDYNLKGTWNRTWLDEAGFSSGPGAEASVDVQVRGGLIARFVYGWETLDFDQDTDFPQFFSRDGHYHAPGAGLYAYLLENKLLAGVDYRFLYDQTEGTQFERDAHQGSVYLRYNLPHEFILTLYANYATEGYVDFIPEPRRHDDPWTLSVSLERELWREGLSATLSYLRYHANSSIGLAEYERDIFGFGLNYDF